MGPNFSEYYEGPMKLGNHPNALDDSNFRVALVMLGPEEDCSIEVHSFGHWAYGSYEQILVHESDAYSLAILQGIADKLADYPILDEEDYSNLTVERMNELWINLSLTERVEMCAKSGGSIFGARLNHPYSDRIEEQLREWVDA